MNTDAPRNKNSANVNTAMQTPEHISNIPDNLSGELKNWTIGMNGCDYLNNNVER
ncbi:MAG: hypothetical protein KF746_22605 [Chitinophagaceae bacterium]|nr:hypothetical protein [Chitinophagaceae bacterium]